MTDPKAVSASLAKWATQEIGFRCAIQMDTDKLSTALLPLCKGSTMLNLWDEVIARVKTKKISSEIRDNIELQKLLLEGKNSTQELAELVRESEILEKDVESLQLQLKKHKEDLQAANLKLTNERQVEQLVQIRSCLTKQYSEYLKSKDHGLKSFCKWFEELYQAYSHSSKKRSEDQKTCMTEVNGIFSLLLETFRSTENGHNVPDLVWSSIRNLIKNYSPESITVCVQRLTEISTAQLKTDECNIDFARDLQEVELKYHAYSGEEKDQDNKLVTLRKMLQQWDLESVKSDTETLMHISTAEKKLFEIDSERTKIVARLEKLYENNPSTLQLAIDTLDAEAELAGYQGCMRSFQTSFSRLQRDISTKSQARDQLVKLQEKINGFNDAMEANQNRIISITKHNSGIKAGLNKRQQEVLKVAESSICSHKGALSKSCKDLQAAIKNRTQAFNLAALGKLFVVSLNNGVETPLNQMSIYRYSNTSNFIGGDAYQRTLHALNLHHSVTHSSVMMHVSQMQKDIRRFTDLQTANENLESASERTQLLKNLEEDAINSEKQQLESLSTKFKAGSEIAKSAVTQARALEQIIDIWYNQPAQLQVPWLRANGMSLKDWIKKLEAP